MQHLAPPPLIEEISFFIKVTRLWQPIQPVSLEHMLVAWVQQIRVPSLKTKMPIGVFPQTSSLMRQLCPQLPYCSSHFLFPCVCVCVDGCTQLSFLGLECN